MPDLDTRLRDYLEHTSPPVTLDEVFAATEPVDRIRPTRPLPQVRGRRGWTWAGAAAVIVLIIVGGVALFGGFGDGTDVVEEPATTATTAAPATSATSPPATVGPTPESSAVTGTTLLASVPRREFDDGSFDPTLPRTVAAASVSETPIGRITWTLIEGGEGSIPGTVTVTSDGFIAEEAGRHYTSVDGIEWTPIDPPAADPTEDVAIPDGIGRNVRGLGVVNETMIGSVDSTASATFTEWISFAWVDWDAITRAYLEAAHGRQLGHQDWVRIDDRTTGVISARSFDTDEHLVDFAIHISGDPDAWQIDVVAEDTGILVGQIFGSLPDLTLEQIAALEWSGRTSTYVVTQDGSSEIVEPAWIEANRQQEQAIVVANDEIFLALIRIGNTESVGDTLIWRSSDGRTWEELGSAPWSAVQEPFRTAVRGSTIMVDVWNYDQRYNVWRTDDGLDWREPTDPPIPVGENPHGETYATPAGWLWLSLDGYSEGAAARSGFDGVSAQIWVSLDGDTWTPVDDWPIPESLMRNPTASGVGGGSGGSTRVSGNTILIHTEWHVEGQPANESLLIGVIEP